LARNFSAWGGPEIYISRRELTNLASANELPWSETDIAHAASAVYAEPLLQLLGFHTTRSIDISAFQEADIIHDLNLPIPERLEATTALLSTATALLSTFSISLRHREYCEAREGWRDSVHSSSRERIARS
jgi:hypothetical protein